MVFALDRYIDRQKRWSEKTFGPGMRTKGITAHIRKELEEIEAEPDDVVEFVDVIILALDGAWRAGYSAAEIVAALQSKQEINFARDWPEPGPEDRPNFHIKT